MPRGNKPQQLIYRPGSGPLKKSNHGVNESESDTNVILRQNQSKNIDSRLKSEGSSPRTDAIDATTQKFLDVSMKDYDNNKKKSKKPEQPLYVPRAVTLAQAKEMNDNSDKNVNSQLNGNSNYYADRGNRSKRYSNRRRTAEVPDNHDEWRAPSPGGFNRNMRQGSEPRGHHNPNNSNWNRTRDTRSVEPGSNAAPRNVNEKLYNKPPSGRRHSTIGLEEKRHKIPNFDTLPPRLKKKYLEENKLTYVPTAPEEVWDGSSVTFQGSHVHHHKQNMVPKPGFPLMGGYSVVPEGQIPNPHANNGVYYTLPNKHRGRGRYPTEYDQNRSMTPDKMYLSPSNSRPSTPTRMHKTKSNENIHRFSEPKPPQPQARYNEERRFNQQNYHGPKASHFGKEQPRETKLVEQPPPPSNLDDRLLAAAPPKEKEPVNNNPLQNTILDWSEEVELNDLLEAEAFSDALTRSSSVTSLMETSTKSTPSTNKKSKKRKNSKRSRKRSSSCGKEKSIDQSSSATNYEDSRSGRNDYGRTRQNSYNSVDSNRDNFKVPDNHRHNRHRRGSRDKRENSHDRHHNRSRNASRESSFDRMRKSSCSEIDNWRDEIRSRQTSEREISREPERKPSEVKKGGILVLPKSEFDPTKPPILTSDRPKLPEIERRLSPGQKSLYDPNNPSKPIIVKTTSTSRANVQQNENVETVSYYTTDVHGNPRPRWYDEQSQYFKASHFPILVKEVKRADFELQYITNVDYLMMNWGAVQNLRNFLMDSLQYFLCYDLKFSQTENIEQHFWKILFHNIIEMIRKAIASDPENKEKYKVFVLALIDEGTKYFEHLLERLESTYNFKINTHLNNVASPQQNHKYFTLLLVCSQKIFLFLGDLGRYREQINETLNYGKCRQWYIKAHEINPKNGKPYNQLAVLAVCARRKLDAVYYYMRSLMSSNPVTSAKEHLVSLFDENKKKYDQGERKRREERLERARQHMKEKESEVKNPSSSLRRETWIHPDSGRREHRTTSTVTDSRHIDSEEEDLAALSSVDVNKRFVISYLHVHGKLIMKIGMETFQETALQMLKEFRALLQHSPVPIPCNRLLQLLALNMFAIESTQLKDPKLQLQSGYRSELQESALVVSLQMFNLILERCVSLIQEHAAASKQQNQSVPQDVHILLPAVKIWCDWLICHSGVWNPPPSTQDYRVGPPGDAWSRLASLVNHLENLDMTLAQSFVQDAREGFEQIRLPEDGVLSGFTPLMYNEQETSYAPSDVDMEAAQFAQRVKKLLFFGTAFLCGLEPPVLKLEFENDIREYVSVVCTSASRSQPPSPPELVEENEVLVESCSEEENELDVESSKCMDVENASSEIRDLLSKKMELQKRQRHQELHHQRAEQILRQAVVSVHIEVKPKYLVPDTNCFIDHLHKLRTIADAHIYTLMVSLVVMGELEGLAKGSKGPQPNLRAQFNAQHVTKVAEAAKHALEFLATKHQFVKCITTKGTVLTSRTFTIEDDSTSDAMTNDDKILATCLTLCKNTRDVVDDEPRKLYREVVLLTDDRNLRVKALARDVPVSELPGFMQWAGLGCESAFHRRQCPFKQQQQQQAAAVK